MNNETSAYSEQAVNSSPRFSPLLNIAPHQTDNTFPFLSRGLQNKKVTCCLAVE
jgi:hypothetical protein